MPGLYQFDLSSEDPSGTALSDRPKPLNSSRQANHLDSNDDTSHKTQKIPQIMPVTSVTSFVTSSIAVKSPPYLPWNKTPSTTFADKQRRARRRSSLCYAESAYSSDSNDDKASHNQPLSKTSSKQTSLSNHSPPPPPPQHTKSPPRPDFQICPACRDDILNSSPLGPSTSLPKLKVTSKRRSSYDPCHEEHLVGSYEESLLSGRMSAPSSQPVPFHIKLGALGSGDKCPAKLKFPKHLSTNFNASFYDYDLYETGTPGPGSPYVGVIDLAEYYAQKRDDKSLSSSPPNTNSLSKFPGYRLSRKGQIQIIISNLQKTAIKLFLIPYNLSDLRPGYKTFFRQKIYLQDNNSGGKTLVQAVHFQVASPSKGRYYLYGDLRLVFQNRASNLDASALSSSKGNSSTYLGISRDRDRLKIEMVSGGFSIFTPNVPVSSPTLNSAPLDTNTHHTLERQPENNEQTSQEICVRCASPLAPTTEPPIENEFATAPTSATTPTPLNADFHQPPPLASPTPISATTTTSSILDSIINHAILTREELKAQMLTDLKASFLDSARP